MLSRRFIRRQRYLHGPYGNVYQKWPRHSATLQKKQQKNIHWIKTESHLFGLLDWFTVVLYDKTSQLCCVDEARQKTFLPKRQSDNWSPDTYKSSIVWTLQTDHIPSQYMDYCRQNNSVSTIAWENWLDFWEWKRSLVTTLDWTWLGIKILQPSSNCLKAYGDACGCEKKRFEMLKTMRL